MTHQHDIRKAAPEPARRLQGQAMESVALPYYMGVVSRSALPASVSSPPNTALRRGNVREDASMNDRMVSVLRPEEVYFFDRDEPDFAAQEDSHHSTQVSSSITSQPVESQSPMCACGPKCICKPACKYQIHICPCTPCLLRPIAGGHENVLPSRSFEFAGTDLQQTTAGLSSMRIPCSTLEECADGQILDHTRQIGSRDLEKPQPDRGFGDGTMSRQKFQAARVPRRKDVGTASKGPLRLRGQRAPTINNDLAYVPQAPAKTPSRKPKDATPLGFYSTHGSHSGQRYPTFNIDPSLAQHGIPTPPVFPTASSTSEQSQSIEAIAATLLQLSSPPPERRSQAVEPTYSTTLRMYSPSTMSGQEDAEPDSRTPSPLSAPRQRRYQCNKTHATITGDDIKSYSHLDEYQPSTPIDPTETSSGTVIYPAIPRSTSAGLFTQGMYLSAVTQSFPSAQAGNPRGPEGSPDQAGVLREDWYGHANRHAAGSESTRARHSSPASSSRGFPPPLPPPLPLPDFIAPRPATKQRYVSAGGTAKLEDRPEIADFSLPPSVTPGISMQRDLLMQRLESVPQFATPTPSTSIGGPMPIRDSEEALRDSSARTSYEYGSDILGIKRDRKESGSSQRIARFKRVFSFAKEGKDKESNKETSPSR